MQQVDEYMIGFAVQAKTRSNCLRRGVGAVLVKDNHLISTGYNGTPKGVTACTSGGCTRCFNSLDYKPGKDYDLCICVHAESNSILQAARFGAVTEGAILYTTLAPCLSCLKEAINAGISGIVYIEPWIMPLEQLDDFNRLTKALGFYKMYSEPVVADEAIRQRITTQA